MKLQLFNQTPAFSGYKSFIVWPGHVSWHIAYKIRHFLVLQMWQIR